MKTKLVKLQWCQLVNHNLLLHQPALTADNDCSSLSECACLSQCDALVYCRLLLSFCLLCPSIMGALDADLCFIIVLYIRKLFSQSVVPLQPLKIYHSTPRLFKVRIEKGTKLLPKHASLQIGCLYLRQQRGGGWSRRMRGVAAVVWSGQCSASANSVSEGWQVWREDTNYVRGLQP